MCVILPQGQISLYKGLNVSDTVILSIRFFLYYQWNDMPFNTHKQHQSMSERTYIRDITAVTARLRHTHTHTHKHADTPVY